MVLTKCPGKVKFGPCSLYGEESIGEPCEEGGVADKVGVHIVGYWQGACYHKEEEEAAAADQQFPTDRLLQ